MINYKLELDLYSKMKFSILDPTFNKYNSFICIFVPEANDVKDMHDSINFMLLNDNLIETYPNRLIKNYIWYICPKLIDFLIILENMSFCLKL
jgi:hypothetical protein